MSGDIAIARPSVTVELGSASTRPSIQLGRPVTEVLIRRTGVPGPAGAGVEPVSAVVDVDVPAGMPLAVSRANGHLVRAAAASKPVSFVAGLAMAATSAGFVAAAGRGPMTMADWTAIAGSVALAPGQTYFLAAAGGLTTVPPGPPNCITIVGIAASATTLLIDPAQPVQL